MPSSINPGKRAHRTAAALLGFMAAFLAVGGGGCTVRQKAPQAPPAPQAPAKPAQESRIILERPEPARLPEDARRWVEEREKRRGTHHADFGDKTYILVAWGEKPTGGYAVRIEEILAGRDADVVVVRLTAPGPTDVVTQALTYPFDLAAFKRRGRPVVYAFLGDLTLASAPAPPGEGGTGQGQGEVSRSKNFEVELPAPGSLITSPVRVKGRARVYEGNFFVELEDGHNILAKRNVQTDGAPSWGEFDFLLDFEKPTNPAGALIFVTYSAEDGRRQEELLVPVRFRFP